MKELIATFLQKFNVNFTEEKSGKELKFLCPFHADKTPSMSINTTNGKYHCFSCHAGGHSLEQFIKRLTGESIKLSDYLTFGDLFTQKVKAIYEHSASHILCNEVTVEFMQQCEQEFSNFVSVFKDDMAYEYLKNKRGLSDATIKKFRLKYAIDGDYKNRIIIPYYKQNTLVGFNSRLTGANKEFLKGLRYRYFINKPEFEDYIFGLDSLSGDEYCILVEGPFDLMYLQQCGFKNVVSTLTTRVTPAHYLKISECKKIIFCFDNDENKKGYEGMLKAATMIHNLDSNKSIFTMKLPDFKDPNECTIQELLDAKSKLKKIGFGEKRNSPMFQIKQDFVQ